MEPFSNRKVLSYSFLWASSSSDLVSVILTAGLNIWRSTALFILCFSIRSYKLITLIFLGLNFFDCSSFNWLILVSHFLFEKLRFDCSIFNWWLRVFYMNWFCSNCLYKLFISLNILSLLLALAPWKLDNPLRSWKPGPWTLESWFSWFWFCVSYFARNTWYSAKSTLELIWRLRLSSCAAWSFWVMKPS